MVKNPRKNIQGIKMKEENEKKYLLMEDDASYMKPLFFDIFDSFSDLEKIAKKDGKLIHQGYLPLEQISEFDDLLHSGIENMIEKIDTKPAELRLRSIGEGFGKGYWVTIKSKGGQTRMEIEHQIDKKTFKKYWPKTEGKRVEKTRLTIPFMGQDLEIDIYRDRKLIVAEIEFDKIRKNEIIIPIGKDVTEDQRYKNRNLAK